jgi:hypothetical protein
MFFIGEGVGLILVRGARARGGPIDKDLVPFEETRSIFFWPPIVYFRR